MKYHIKFQRDFEVEFEALDMESAEKLAHDLVAQFPAGSCKLLSIYADDYKAPPDDPAPVVSPPRGGSPVGGGTPGTPVVKTEILVDQIAEAA
jgi:hypothetical protein